MRKNTIRSVMTASLLSALTICAPYSSDQIYADDGKLNITIETLELDLNQIPEDRYVKLNVRIDDNPGINSMVLNICFDDHLSAESESLFTKISSDVSGYGGSIFSENEASINISFDINNWYYGNEDLIALGFKLPENCSPGDFYSVSFTEGPEDNNSRYSSVSGVRFGITEFGSVNSGGIRIKAQQQEQRYDPEPEPQQQEEPQYQEQNTPPAPSEQPEQTAPPVTSAASAITSSDTVTSLTTTSAVTEITTSAVISATSSETTVTSPASASETSLTSASSFDQDEEHNNGNNKGKMIIPAVCAGLVAVIILFLLLKKRNTNE